MRKIKIKLKKPRNPYFLLAKINKKAGPMKDRRTPRGGAKKLDISEYEEK
jgi:hypothetical protein